MTQPNFDEIDPITKQMEAVRKALISDRATAGRYGVAVEVLADGTLQAVRIDKSVTPYGAELGDLITKLAREALENARANVRDRIAELSADPRIAAAVESIEIASEQPAQARTEKKASPPIPDDELSEEELIELNERRNQSWFQ